jgi:hypothetical protein
MCCESEKCIVHGESWTIECLLPLGIVDIHSILEYGWVLWMYYLESRDPFLLASGSAGARIGAGCINTLECIHVLVFLLNVTYCFRICIDGRFWLVARNRPPYESRLTLDKDKYTQDG